MEEKELIKQKDSLAQVGEDGKFRNMDLSLCLFPPGNRVDLDVGKGMADSCFDIYSAEVMKAKEPRMLLLNGMRDRHWILD